MKDQLEQFILEYIKDNIALPDVETVGMKFLDATDSEIQEALSKDWDTELSDAEYYALEEERMSDPYKYYGVAR